MTQLEESTRKEVSLNNIVKIDQKQIRNHLGEMVRQSVEDTLNMMLDAGADQLCNAQRYERTESRRDRRGGYYNRKLLTRAGEVKLKMPKLRRMTFETAIIERYKRRESSVEEALIEMYLAGVSVRRVEDITEALWGTKVSPATISNLNQKVYEQIDNWRRRKLESTYPYVYLDGLVLKRCWAGEVKNVSILVAIGVDKDGYREVLGSCEGAREDKAGWVCFLRELKQCGLKGVRLFVSDKCLGLIESLAEVFPEAYWKRFSVHCYRNFYSHVPHNKKRQVTAMLKAIHAQEDKAAAIEKALQVISKLDNMKLSHAAKIVKEGYLETMSYYHYPSEHWRSLRTNNLLERIMREIRRRTRVAGNFPDGRSALMLATARLRHISSKQWITRRYMNMEHLYELEKQRKIKNKDTA
jgi:transposase-like protein